MSNKDVSCELCLKANNKTVEFEGRRYCSDCIKVIKGSNSWSGIDVDEFINDLRGRRFSDSGDIIRLD